jgi:hypothetical protein
MLVYGDEFARTQNGNNNPYNVDSVATWNNYGMIASDSPHTVSTGTSGEAYHNNFGTDAAADGKNAAFLFTQYVLNLRKNSSALRQGDYAMPISFAKSDGSGGFNGYSDRAVRIHLDGSAVGSEDWLLFVNMWTASINFTPPAPDAGKKWVRVIDTAAWAEGNNNLWDPASAWTLGGSYGVNPWSIVVFKSVNAGVAPGQVTINEILANEPGSATAGEFVELVNVGGESVDISGWTVSDASSVRHTFAAGTTLAAGKAIVVYGGASGIPGGLTNAVAASTGQLNLANGGDTVTVMDATGATIQSFTYPSSLAGTDGVSMNRNPDASGTGDFILHTALSALSSSGGVRVDGSAF